MARRNWTTEQEKLLTELYPKTHTREIAKRLNKSYESVKSRATVLKLKKAVGFHGKYDWTMEKDNWLRQNYPCNDIVYLQTHLKASVSSIYGRAKLLGIGKDEKYKEAHKKRFVANLIKGSKKTQFKKGFTPFNKGKKQREYMSADAIKRTQKGWFKKGHSPHNERTDGYITERRDTNSGIVYKYIRLSKGEWQLLSRYNWEKNTGEELTNDEVIRFKDGNSMNCDFENLEKVTTAENLMINSFTDSSVVKRFLRVRDKDVQDEILKNHPELIELARNNVKLKMKLNERCN
ncbi:HNH endonuclease [Galbibacter sp. BG1]|uniref:HNH endonuclease n=1 Tax=Galbibacter sp. BG1 TaxID=1170699 RepID=UPI0015BD3FC1|nr:HNH endonuclease [Galbibacter sp. BG1]QLE02903.1 HNH endonuclease [Galbibacter sp. BG1]